MSSEHRWPDIIEAAFAGELHGGIRKMAVAMARASTIFEDIPWVESNMRYGHEWSVRAGPYNVARCTAGVGAARDADEFLKKLFYGNPTRDADEFCGFSTMYNTVSTSRAQNAENVIDAGADGGSSIWLIRWSPGALYVVYPKGSSAGFSPHGVTAGLIVENWRCALRIANISEGCWSTLPDILRRASNRFPFSPTYPHAAWYMGGTAHNMLGLPEKLLDFKVCVIPQLHDREEKVV